MEVTFWGVRGSIPAPGPGTVRYGGNTPCVSVRSREGDLVILDLGTGARGLGQSLIEGAFAKGQGHATILLSLAQWDHIQGFPFFAPFYVPGNMFTVHGGGSDQRDLEAILERQMAAQYFPVQTYRNMAATITLVGVHADEPLMSGSLTVYATRVGEGPLAATTYRLVEGDRTIVYAGHGWQGAAEASLLPLPPEGVDLLIHECSFSPEDARKYADRGLSSVEHAVASAVKLRAKTLALFHYDQDYTDAEVDALAALGQRLSDEQGARTRVIAAAERQTLRL